MKVLAISIKINILKITVRMCSCCEKFRVSLNGIKQMIRSLKYCLPVLLTCIFLCCLELGWFLVLPLILPIAKYIGNLFGQFTPREVWREYKYFHSTAAVNVVVTVSGLFFIAFNFYVGYFLYKIPLSTVDFLLIVFGALVFNSNFSISLAHELMHRKSKLNRTSGKILLLVNGFFYLEKDHLYIHHPFVGTLQDPASARRGEGLYRYWLRSISGRIKILFGFKKGSFVSHAGRQETIMNLVLCAGLLSIGAILSKWVFFWLLIQFTTVTFLYETITYIQHYGLRRHKNNEGNVEKVTLSHSWNCYYRASAYLYYCMPIHALHHINLVTDDMDSNMYPGPSFPFPFGRMVLLAFIPIRWFEVMDPQISKSW